MLNHPNLKLWLRLDGDVLDASGNGFNGTAVGTTYQQSIFGRGGDFAPTKYVKDIGGLADFSFIQNTGVCTVCFWMKLSTSSDTGLPIGNTDTTSQKGFFINIYSSGTRMQFCGLLQQSSVYTFRVTGEVSLNTTDIYHVACVANRGVSGGNKIYINGVAVTLAGNSEATLSTGNSTNKLALGWNPRLGDSQMATGSIFDDVQIYNIALPRTDILRIMQGKHPLTRS